METTIVYWGYILGYIGVIYKRAAYLALQGLGFRA